MSAWAMNWDATDTSEATWEAPLLAVVDASGGLAAWVETVCESMRLRLCIAPDATSLGVKLGDTQPIAVLCADLGGGGRPVGRLLKLVANYNRDMPVLLMTSDDPETLGSIDAAVELWPLTDVQRIAGPVPVAAVVAFLARAGRLSGALRMMAV